MKGPGHIYASLLILSESLNLCDNPDQARQRFSISCTLLKNALENSVDINSKIYAQEREFKIENDTEVRKDIYAEFIKRILIREAVSFLKDRRRKKVQYRYSGTLFELKKQREKIEELKKQLEEESTQSGILEKINKLIEKASNRNIKDYVYCPDDKNNDHREELDIYYKFKKYAEDRKYREINCNEDTTDNENQEVDIAPKDIKRAEAEYYQSDLEIIDSCINSDNDEESRLAQKVKANLGIDHLVYDEESDTYYILGCCLDNKPIEEECLPHYIYNKEEYKAFKEEKQFEELCDNFKKKLDNKEFLSEYGDKLPYFFLGSVAPDLFRSQRDGHHVYPTNDPQSEEYKSSVKRIKDQIQAFMINCHKFAKCKCIKDLLFCYGILLHYALDALIVSGSYTKDIILGDKNLRNDFITKYQTTINNKHNEKIVNDQKQAHEGNNLTVKYRNELYAQAIEDVWNEKAIHGKYDNKLDDIIKCVASDIRRGKMSPDGKMKPDNDLFTSYILDSLGECFGCLNTNKENGEMTYNGHPIQDNTSLESITDSKNDPVRRATHCLSQLGWYFYKQIPVDKTRAPEGEVNFEKVKVRRLDHDSTMKEISKQVIEFRKLGIRFPYAEYRSARYFRNKYYNSSSRTAKTTQGDNNSKSKKNKSTEESYQKRIELLNVANDHFCSLEKVVYIPSINDHAEFLLYLHNKKEIYTELDNKPNKTVNELFSDGARSEDPLYSREILELKKELCSFPISKYGNEFGVDACIDNSELPGYLEEIRKKVDNTDLPYKCLLGMGRYYELRDEREKAISLYKEIYESKKDSKFSRYPSYVLARHEEPKFWSKLFSWNKNKIYEEALKYYKKVELNTPQTGIYVPLDVKQVAESKYKVGRYTEICHINNKSDSNLSENIKGAISAYFEAVKLGNRKARKRLVKLLIKTNDTKIDKSTVKLLNKGISNYFGKDQNKYNEAFNKFCAAARIGCRHALDLADKVIKDVEAQNGQNKKKKNNKGKIWSDDEIKNKRAAVDEINEMYNSTEPPHHSTSLKRSILFTSLFLICSICALLYFLGGHQQNNWHIPFLEKTALVVHNNINQIVNSAKTRISNITRRNDSPAELSDADSTAGLPEKFNSTISDFEKQLDQIKPGKISQTGDSEIITNDIEKLNEISRELTRIRRDIEQEEIDRFVTSGLTDKIGELEKKVQVKLVELTRTKNSNDLHKRLADIQIVFETIKPESILSKDNDEIDKTDSQLKKISADLGQLSKDIASNQIEDGERESLNTSVKELREKVQTKQNEFARTKNSNDLHKRLADIQIVFETIKPESILSKDNDEIDKTDSQLKKISADLGQLSKDIASNQIEDGERESLNTSVKELREKVQTKQNELTRTKNSNDLHKRLADIQVVFETIKPESILSKDNNEIDKTDSQLKKISADLGQLSKDIASNQIEDGERESLNTSVEELAEKVQTKQNDLARTKNSNDLHKRLADIQVVFGVIQNDFKRIKTEQDNPFEKIKKRLNELLDNMKKLQEDIEKADIDKSQRNTLNEKYRDCKKRIDGEILNICSHSIKEVNTSIREVESNGWLLKVHGKRKLDTQRIKLRSIETTIESTESSEQKERILQDIKTADNRIKKLINRDKVLCTLRQIGIIVIAIGTLFLIAMIVWWRKQYRRNDH